MLSKMPNSMAMLIIQVPCSINDDQYEEILSHNEILNYIKQQDDDGTKLWKFRHIIAHEGPLKPSDPSYKGSKYNVMIECENGEATTEPLTIIAADTFPGSDDMQLSTVGYYRRKSTRYIANPVGAATTMTSPQQPDNNTTTMPPPTTNKPNSSNNQLQQTKKQKSKKQAKTHQ